VEMKLSCEAGFNDGNAHILDETDDHYDLSMAAGDRMGDLVCFLCHIAICLLKAHDNISPLTYLPRNIAGRLDTRRHAY
jgi:hypothetical protein